MVAGTASGMSSKPAESAKMATDLLAIACAVFWSLLGTFSLLSLFRRVRKFEAEQQIDKEHLDVLQKLVKKC